MIYVLMVDECSIAFTVNPPGFWKYARKGCIKSLLSHFHYNENESVVLPSNIKRVPAGAVECPDCGESLSKLTLFTLILQYPSSHPEFEALLQAVTGNSGVGVSEDRPESTNGAGDAS